MAGIVWQIMTPVTPHRQRRRSLKADVDANNSHFLKISFTNVWWGQKLIQCICSTSDTLSCLQKSPHSSFNERSSLTFVLKRAAWCTLTAVYLKITSDNSAFWNTDALSTLHFIFQFPSTWQTQGFPLGTRSGWVLPLTGCMLGYAPAAAVLNAISGLENGWMHIFLRQRCKQISRLLP